MLVHLFVLKDLGKEDNTHTFSSETGVTWDNIGGLPRRQRINERCYREPN